MQLIVLTLCILPFILLQPSLTEVATISTQANMFLERHYNSTLRLIAETNTSQKYWLVSDNLLASYALKNYNQAISQEINDTLKSYAIEHNLPTDPNGLPIAYKHEALIGDILDHPFRNSSQENGTLLLSGTNYSIVTEIDNFTIIADWKSYADLVALRGISLVNQIPLKILA
jgi:hypothetical protein